MANKDTQQRINALKQEEQLQRNLQSMLTERITASGKLTKIQEELSNSLLETNDLESKILEVQQKKDDVLKKYRGAQADVGRKLIEQLETMEEYLKMEKKRKDKAAQLRDAQDELKDSLFQSVGLSSSMVDKLLDGGIAVAGLLLLAKVVQYLGEAVKRSIELSQQTGATAAQTAQYESNIRMAQFSVEGLLLGFDKLSASASELVSLTGNLNISPDTIKGTAALNELLGDQGAAARLQRSFETISDDSNVFRENLEDIATNQGVSAKVVFEALSQEGARLNSLSKEQVKQLAEEAILIKKMGVDRQKAVDLASSALDLESSLAKQIKLQQITGQDLSAEFEALRAAQASGKALEVSEAQRDLALKTADAAGQNLQIGRQVNEALGMENAERQNILNAQSASNDLSNEAVSAEASKAGFLEKNLGTIINTGIALAGVMAAFSLINKLFGGKKGNPIANFTEGFGKPKVLQGAAAMVLVGASVALLGVGFKQFMEVEWSAMGKAGVAILALTAAMFGLGALLTGPGAVIFGAGVIGFIALGAAMTVLGVGIMSMATGIDMLSGLTDVLTPLTGLAQGLLILAPSFAAFGLSLIPLALGLAAITPFLPTLLALGATGAILGSIFGGGGESAGDSAGGGTGGGSELLDEIKGLRSDIQSQPILIQVDGKVVSEITKSQLKQSSFSRQMGR